MDSTAPMPSPERIFETLTADAQAAALETAIDLDVFTRIGEGTDTAEAIAAACQASPRGTRILLDFLTVHGFLAKAGARYSLAPEAAAFLDRNSPAWMGSVAGFLRSSYIRSGFESLGEAVRKGTSQKDLSSMEPEHPMWVEFARCMAPMMGMPSQLAAQAILQGSQEPMRVLDIAAGHGLWGLAFANQNPNAKVVAQDWPNVLEVARENAQAFGASDRFETIPGSAFEVDFAGPYDLILLPNFLHHFDPPTNEELLRKVRSALRPGGKLAVVEFVPNEDRVSPRTSAAFSMVMLTQTPSGDAYTFPELESMLAKAGFGKIERQPIGPSPQTLILAENP